MNVIMQNKQIELKNVPIFKHPFACHSNISPAKWELNSYKYLFSSFCVCHFVDFVEMKNPVNHENENFVTLLIEFEYDS